MKLSQEERQKIKRLHRKVKERRFADRLKSILLLDDDFTCQEIGRILLLDDDTIRNYRKQYLEAGIESLLSDSFKGRQSYLTKEQLAILEQHLSKKVYTSIAEIIAKVKELFGVVLGKSRMTEIVRKLGFRYKKPKLLPSKINLQAQEQFVEEYKELKESLPEEDQIYFMDGVHPQHNSKPAYGWIKKDQTKHLPSNTGRKRVNINGALNLKTNQVCFLECERINSQTVIEHLEKLLKTQTKGKIYIVLDNARYYRSRVIKAFLEKNSRIEFKFLPAYSPNLNIIERLWLVLKKEVVYNKFYEKFSDFRWHILDFFDKKHWDKEKYAKFLTDKFHIIQPNFSGF